MKIKMARSEKSGISPLQGEGLGATPNESIGCGKEGMSGEGEYLVCGEGILCDYCKFKPANRIMSSDKTGSSLNNDKPQNNSPHLREQSKVGSSDTLELQIDVTPADKRPEDDNSLIRKRRKSDPVKTGEIREGLLHPASSGPDK